MQLLSHPVPLPILLQADGNATSSPISPVSSGTSFDGCTAAQSDTMKAPDHFEEFAILGATGTTETHEAVLAAQWRSTWVPESWTLCHRQQKLRVSHGPSLFGSLRLCRLVYKDDAPEISMEQIAVVCIAAVEISMEQSAVVCETAFGSEAKGAPGPSCSERPRHVECLKRLTLLPRAVPKLRCQALESETPPPDLPGPSEVDPSEVDPSEVWL